MRRKDQQTNGQASYGVAFPPLKAQRNCMTYFGWFFKRMRLENEKKSQEKDSQEANFDEEEKEKTEKKKEEKTEGEGLMEEGKTSSILREAEYTNVEGRRYR